MSTRSVLAIPEGDSWKGRYCHNDGYPSWQIPALLGLHQAHGDDITKFLTEDHCSWSGVHGDGGFCHCHQEDGTPSPVETHVWDGDVEFERWVRPHPDAWDIEWVYILNDRGVFVLIGEGRHDPHPTWRPLAFVPWSTTKTDWTDIECGPNFEWCGHVASYHFEVPQESWRLSTAKWLSRQPLDVDDAVAFTFQGQVWKKTGSGSRERKFVFGEGYHYTNRWFERCESPTGVRQDLFVYRTFKTVAPKLAPGITPIYPPTKETAS